MKPSLIALGHTLAVALWLIGSGAGCQHSPATTADKANTTITGAKLRPRSVVYVAIPPDALYKKDLMLDSGKTTAVMVRDAFAKHTRRSYLGRHPESLAEGMATCAAHRCDYLVYPTLLRWEDRKTEFSGIRDRVEIRLAVYDPNSGECLHATTLQQRGPWLTSGGENPSDFLPELIQKYVASLFQENRSPTGIP